jgi:O-antigen ligase
VAARTSPVSPPALVLAVAIPILFLHVKYQPGVSVGFGSTTINAYLSDFAVLAVVVTALLEGVRHGFAPLTRGRALWLALALFLAWMFIEVGLGHHHAAAYSWRTHGVTAAKFAEYALLAPSVPLLLRRSRDALLVAGSLVIWSVLATSVGIAQFFGADIFFKGAAGHRQASFLSEADFAALSVAALLVGVVALALPRLGLRRGLVATAITTGVLGTIIAGALASVLGLATALVALAVVLFVRGDLERRRVARVAAVAVIVIGGAVAIRGSDLSAFARFLGAKQHATQARVQTYAHRTLLVWLGWQIWKNHPVAGVGWEGSAEPVNFVPYLPAAHRHFPTEAPLAFPTAAPDRRYGVQNSWVQALADLGVIGLVLWASVFGAAAWLAARAAVSLGAANALYALAATALLVWLWTSQGFVAGIPLDALTWLAFGLAATRLQVE